MSIESTVVGVFKSEAHRFSKDSHNSIILLEGLGVAGDAHCGVTVQHIWDQKKDPTRPNLRQVHLMQAELFDDVSARGFNVVPGDLGENITTRGLDLLALPTGTLLKIGSEAIVKVTGLRNPCVQINRFQPGLMEAVIERPKGAPLIRKAGVMSVVVKGGAVVAGDLITVELPDAPYSPLAPV